MRVGGLDTGAIAGAGRDLPSGVFLSYSQADQEIVLRLKRELERFRLRIRIDVESAVPGGDLREFVRESVRSTEVTVWIVSERSLLSGWVGAEISTSIQDLLLWHRRRLIACYLDDGFLEPEFRLRLTEKLDTELARIDRLLPEYVAKRIDTTDLNSDKTRLHELRAQLGKLIDWLKNCLCIDIRGEQFLPGVERLVHALSPTLANVRLAPLVAAADFERRKDEIHDLVANGDAGRALKRLMDFVTDFSPRNKEHRRRVVVINMNYGVLETTKDVALADVRRERTEIVLDALTLLDEIVDALPREVA